MYRNISIPKIFVNTHNGKTINKNHRLRCIEASMRSKEYSGNALHGGFGYAE